MMYRERNKSDSYSYIEFDKELKSFIYKNPVSFFSNLVVFSFLKLKIYIHFFSFTVFIFSIYTDDFIIIDNVFFY